jgi:hypothetical protein
MAVNSADFIGAMLNEQARVNAAIDDGDVNVVVEDLFDIGAAGTEEIGMAAGETITALDYGGGPHHWGDDDMIWGFFKWA